MLQDVLDDCKRRRDVTDSDAIYDSFKACRVSWIALDPRSHTYRKDILKEHDCNLTAERGIPARQVRHTGQEVGTRPLKNGVKKKKGLAARVGDPREAVASFEFLNSFTAKTQLYILILHHSEQHIHVDQIHI